MRVTFLLFLLAFFFLSCNRQKTYLIDEIPQQTQTSIQYLLGKIDSNHNGIHKFYFPTENRLEQRLHTIYTASTLFTLIKFYLIKKDNKIWDQIEASAEFILSMQKNKSPYNGAFHYSFFLDKNTKEDRFVVGTTSKSIFTLIKLYQLTKNEKYLKSATRGADWLVKMVDEKGKVMSYIKKRKGSYWSTKKESILYTGQVLSALSRIYKVTNFLPYLKKATLIANTLRSRIKNQGCYLSDDYRSKNPVSSSWAIQALLDYYRVSLNPNDKNIVYKCSSELIKKQRVSAKNKRRIGSYPQSESSSGSSWVAEVLTEVYELCKSEKRNCQNLLSSIYLSQKWFMQFFYSEDSTKTFPNPAGALGGFRWSQKENYIRTDSVCHGLNSFFNLNLIKNNIPLI